MTHEDIERLQMELSNNMSAEAILKRLNIVRDLYESAKRLSNFHRINGEYGMQLPELDPYRGGKIKQLI